MHVISVYMCCISNCSKLRAHSQTVTVIHPTLSQIRLHAPTSKVKQLQVVFEINCATGAACQQRTLTPPDTWSCPTLGFACVLKSRPISPELLSFEHSSVLLLCFIPCICSSYFLSFIYFNFNVLRYVEYSLHSDNSIHYILLMISRLFLF